MSRSVMPSASIRATPAAIWSTRPCIRSRSVRSSSSLSELDVVPGRRAARQRLVAQADQLGALVGEHGRQERLELTERRVRLVDIVEAGHAADSSRTGACTRLGVPSRSATIGREERMDLGLVGARALLGGASSGLGRRSARALVDEGARVALVSRSPDRLAAQVDGLGAAATAVPADRPRPDGPADAVATASKGWAAWTSCWSTAAARRRAGSRTSTRRRGRGRSTGRCGAAPADPRRTAAPPAQRPAGDPRDPVVLGARADPRV